MISFNIRCSKEHVFEAWFNNSSAYEAQAKAGEIACPICGDTKVEKAPMAPRVNMGKSRAVANKTPSPAMVREFIMEGGLIWGRAPPREPTPQLRGALPRRAEIGRAHV